MKAIHIRDVDADTLARLKLLARSHRRSLQGELHVILERAARMAPTGGVEKPLDLVTTRTRHGTTWRREEIYGSQGR